VFDQQQQKTATNWSDKPRHWRSRKSFSGRNRRSHDKATIRRLKAVKLRFQGLSYPTIAARLGVDAATAWRDVQTQLKFMHIEGTEQAERARRDAHGRLEALVKALWPKRTQPKAAHEIVAAIELDLKFYDLLSASARADAPALIDQIWEKLSGKAPPPPVAAAAALEEPPREHAPGILVPAATQEKLDRPQASTRWPRRELMTVRDYARRIGVSRAWMHLRARSPDFPRVWISKGRWRIHRSTMDAWLQARSDGRFAGCPENYIGRRPLDELKPKTFPDAGVHNGKSLADRMEAERTGRGLSTVQGYRRHSESVDRYPILAAVPAFRTPRIARILDGFSQERREDCFRCLAKIERETSGKINGESFERAVRGFGDARSVLAVAREHDVMISVANDGQLYVRPSSRITDELRAGIREHVRELRAILLEGELLPPEDQ
jgi:hypothetical protein